MKFKIILITCSIIILIVTFLLVSNYNYKSKFFEAIENGDLNRISSLIKKDMDLDTIYKVFGINNFDKIIDNPMTIACYHRNFEVIKFLLNNGATANHIKEVSWSPLIVSTRYFKQGNSKIIELLLENGADVNYSIEDEIPSFLIISSYDSKASKEEFLEEKVKMFMLFVDKGLNLKVVDNNNNNLLHLASEYEVFPIVKYLINNKILDINSLNKNNETSLILLAKRNKNDYNLIKYLLDNGIDQAIKDINGKTALDYAKETNNLEMIKLLQAYK